MAILEEKFSSSRCLLGRKATKVMTSAKVALWLFPGFCLGFCKLNVLQYSNSFIWRFCLGLFCLNGLFTRYLRYFLQRKTYLILVKSSTHLVQCLLGRHTEPKLSIVSLECHHGM